MDRLNILKYGAHLRQTGRSERMSGSRSKLPIAALAALLLATAGFLHTFLREAAAKDDAAPVIVCSSSEIHVSVDASEEELLFGVTAMDAEDGDITSSVVIESISSFVEPGKSIITYAAFDSHNHVATASRTLLLHRLSFAAVSHHRFAAIFIRNGYQSSAVYHGRGLH